MSDLQSKRGALGDAIDRDDPRPLVFFVGPGGQASGYYVNVRMSVIPRVGDRVRLHGNIGVGDGVCVPEPDKDGPGTKLARSAVLTGVVEAIEWTLRGEPDDVFVDVELRDVVESDD